MSNAELYAGGSGTKLSDFQRGYMKTLYDSGVPVKNIAQHMRISRNAVHDMIKRYFQYKERREYQTLLNYDDEREIIIAAAENRYLTAADLLRDKKINKKGVSKDTIERILNYSGLKCRRKRVMQYLKDDHKEERFRLAKRYQKWSKERMNKIFYLYESNICLQQNGPQFVRKYDDEKWRDEIFRKFSKVHPLSIDTSMMISYKGVDHIKWTISGTWINREYYGENIRKKYVLNNWRLKNDSDFGGMFQHDQARAHMATATRELFEEYNISFIEWPPKGSDLNPIELCFREIQRRAKKHYNNIKTQDQLWKYIKDIVFKDDFTEFVQKCYNIMPDRWKQVQGGVIDA